MKKNWIIIWHDRHSDDEYKIVLNATYSEAKEIELEVAKRAGWENETDVDGYGEYGYGEDYYINLKELDGSNGMNDVITRMINKMNYIKFHEYWEGTICCICKTVNPTDGFYEICVDDSWKFICKHCFKKLEINNEKI